MHRGFGPLRAVAATIVLGACFSTAAGCTDAGGGDRTDAGDSPADQETAAGARMPSPEKPPEAVARQLMRTLETAAAASDCASVRALNERSPQRFACPSPPGEPRIRDFEIVASATYGTAAVIDYTTRKEDQGATMVTFVDPDLRWGVSRFGVLSDEHPTTATSDDDSRQGFRATVDRYLDAVRSRDCDEYRRHTFLEGVPETICAEIFPTTALLARRLRADPATEPVYLGGNAVFGVYGIATERPRPAYETIVVVKTPPGALVPYVVLAAHPGPAPAGELPRGNPRRRPARPDSPPLDSSPAM